VKLFYIILAGLAGTAAMSSVIFLLSLVTRRILRIPLVLGTMLLGKTHSNGGLSNGLSTKLVGGLAHYTVGVLYAIGYLALWESGVGTITASWGMLIGLGNGILAMIIWYFFFMIHPRPPHIKLERYLIEMVFSHVLFGFVVTYVYYHLTHVEYSFWQ
jgi:hypothetical protein